MVIVSMVQRCLLLQMFYLSVFMVAVMLVQNFEEWSDLRPERTLFCNVSGRRREPCCL